MVIQDLVILTAFALRLEYTLNLHLTFRTDRPMTIEYT